MKKIEHKILKKPIQTGSLVSLISQNWYDYNGNLTPWSGSVYIGPNIGDGMYNFTGSVDNRYSSSVAEGYYKWGGSTWISTSLSGISESYNLPIFLESTVDELGVMVSFDGGVEQIEQLCNFTYTQSGSMVTLYNSVNPDKLRKIVDQEYTINWGDGSPTSGSIVNKGIVGQGLPSIEHKYPTVTGSTTASYVLTLSLDSPWTKEKISKNIFISTGSVLTNQEILGTFTYTGVEQYISGSLTNFYLQTGKTQNYLNDYEYVTGYTATPAKSFKFMAIGKSRVNELKQYGTSSIIPGMVTGQTSGTTEIWTGYTIDNLYYQDFPNDFTMITGSVPNHRFGPTSGYTYEISGSILNTVPYLTTSGNTTNFVTEYVVNHMLTRNEHFLGFIDDPTVYSDIFVERGRQGVMENNLRLGEIDNMSELDVYGNGYFNVKKQ